MFNARYGDYQRYVRSLSAVKDLKWGRLVVCTACRANWYLGPDGKYFSRIPANRVSVAEQWSSRKLVPSAEMLSVLDGIRPVAPVAFTHGDDQIIIPCRAKGKDGQAFDMCLASFQKQPPIMDQLFKNILLGDEVEQVAPSDDALPWPVRMATATAQEISMGFSPTLVETQDGKQFVLHWAQSFFESGGYRGKDLKLSSARLDRNRLPPIVSQDDGKIRWLIFDWQDDYLNRWKIERTLNASPIELLNSGAYG